MIRKFLAPIVLTVCATLVSTITSAGQLTDSLIVNSTYTNGGQTLKNLTSGANGEKLILWKDDTQNASWVQRISSTGAISTSKFLVKRGAFAIAASKIGGFAILAPSQDSSGTGTFLTIYDRNGIVTADLIPVNNSSLSNGLLAIDQNGVISTAYTDYQNPKWTISLKRFSANGVLLGSEAIVEESTTSNLALSGFAIDSIGNMTISWLNINGYNPDVWMRRFNTSGSPLSNSTLVHTYSNGIQSGGEITTSPKSGFVITWNSQHQDGNGYSIYAQRYDVNGAKVNTPIRITNSLFLNEPAATTAMMDDGSFVTTWAASIKDANGINVPTIYARQFRNNGLPLSNEFVVDNVASERSKYPMITMDLAGNYTVGWTQYSATNDYDAMVKSFQMDSIPFTQVLLNNQALVGVSGATTSWRYVKVTTPPGASRFNISMSGSSGDADLYVRFGAYPTASKWDMRPYLTGSNESVQISNPPPGDWYIAINGYSSYSALNLSVSFF